MRAEWIVHNLVNMEKYMLHCQKFQTGTLQNTWVLLLNIMTKTDFNFDRFNLSDENSNSNVKYLLIQNFL